MKNVLVVLAVTYAAVSANAQCSLCRLAVEQDASLGTAFNKAILLLMIPALGAFAGVFYLAIRSKARRPPTAASTDAETR